jgi:hypothetical protein
MRIVVRLVVALLFILLIATPAAQAQYFGRNKVQWENFDFKVLQTEHFDIYYYDQEADVVQDIGRMSERWYARLSRVFGHSFKRKPIVLYANAADFHQTTTTGGIIGEGTGGFTDAFMNRVVLPLTGDYAQNDHVLGHEMVHVFQYDIAATANANRRRFALESMPLWLVEGMAEYLSKGRVDPLTSMWIRDATINDRMPDIRELTRDPRYFPYRYGQALMAYIGARFGDEAVVRYFLSSGSVGPEDGVERALGISAKQLFKDWEESARELYNPIVQARQDTLTNPLIGKKPEPAPVQLEGDKKRKRRRRGATELNIGPALSPDGRYIAFLSARELFSIDLFLADAKTGKIIRRLVSSDRDPHFESLRFIESAGSWSPDGRTLVFVTDRGADTTLEQLQFSNHRLATIDIGTGRITEIEAFPKTKHINPQYAPDGRSIYFLANPEGIPDLYRITVPEGKISRVTNVDTGIAGITDMSPAMSVALRSGDIAFSLYEDDNYNIYSLPAGTIGTEIAAGPGPSPNAAPRAALLPPLRGTGSEITAYLMRPEEGLPPASTQFTERAYSNNLHLSYLGPPTLGVGMNEFGFGAGGSVTAFFSDILGQHNLGFTFAGGGGGSSGGSGNLADQLGGELFYLNQKSRLNWGADVVHVPYVYTEVGYGVGNVPSTGERADVYQIYRQIQTVSDVSGLAQYPFSTTRRIEGAAGVQRYAFKEELETWYIVGNTIKERTVERSPNSFTVNLGKASTAFVGDSSVYGFISPINGTRYRYEVETLTGDLKFTTALADWRKYFFHRPVTLAVRGLHYGRYGSGAEDNRLSDLYLGQGSLVRGYDPYSIDPVECGTNTAICPVFDRLIGTRIAATSIELRAPLLGTREFGLINASFLPTEIFAFADAGAAWRAGSTPEIKWATRTNERVPVASVGFGLRILLSYIPIELYAAKPFQRPDEQIVYGFNIIPGW